VDRASDTTNGDPEGVSPTELLLITRQTESIRKSLALHIQSQIQFQSIDTKPVRLLSVIAV